MGGAAAEDGVRTRGARGGRGGREGGVERDGERETRERKAGRKAYGKLMASSVGVRIPSRFGRVISTPDLGIPPTGTALPARRVSRLALSHRPPSSALAIFPRACDATVAVATHATLHTSHAPSPPPRPLPRGLRTKTKRVRCTAHVCSIC